MKSHKLLYILFFIFCLVGTNAFSNQKVDKNGNRPKVVIIEGKSIIPLRVLTRPNSRIYSEPKEDANIVTDDVGTFQQFFVYTRPKVNFTSTEQKGWYQIGDDNRGNVTGWIKAEDVIEWKHNMCLAYTHPKGRKRVLMFNKLGALRDLVKLPDEERVKLAEEYYTKIERKTISKDFPITAIEPDGAIDITKQFYLLPILEHAPIEIGENEIDGKLLKIASAPKTGTQAPRDIIAWVTDRDLIDPYMPSLEVRVLVNKRQLDQLKITLAEIITAARTGRISKDKLFDILLAVSVTTCRAPEYILKAQSLSDAGVIPEFMQGLPYKSQIMTLSNEMWASWGQVQQNSFIDDLDGKLKLCKSILDSPEGWVQLNEGDEPDEYVYLLSLEYLP